MNSQSTPLAHQTDTYINPFEIGNDHDNPHATTSSTAVGLSDPFADPLNSNLIASLDPDFVDLASPIATSHSAIHIGIENTTSLQSSLNPQNMSSDIPKSADTSPINMETTSHAPLVSGSIGQSGSGSGGGISSGGRGSFVNNTLDEPVSETIVSDESKLRDLRNVAIKLQQVLHPKARRDVLKDSQSDQEILVFTWVFVIVWCGAAIVTVNAKLLGGNVSFFQSVCVLGYCIFPLVIAALITLFAERFFIRLPLVIVAFSWASYASVNFLSSSHLANRRALAVYPLFLFYFIIAWAYL
ncbi:hypothetical protein G9A89_012544 [Geosiphon pyriformis]|nr:hypothetical protein G9A89_012544 [Geosiphon pyriformis]